MPATVHVPPPRRGGELEPLRLLAQLRQLASAEVQEWLDAQPPSPL